MYKFIKKYINKYIYHFGIFIPSTILLFIFFYITFLMLSSISWPSFFKVIFSHKKILFFTFYQAFFGSTLVLLLAIFSIISFTKLLKSRAGFIFEKLIQIPFFLPSIVGCLCILAFYGQEGTLSPIENNPNEDAFISKWTGLLICYIFYYLPYFLKNISKIIPALITPEVDRLAALLGVRKISYFLFILWPLFKVEIKSLYILTFLYCMQSFTTILIFGGPPDFITVELAIYDLITIEKEFNSALQLSLVLTLFNILALYAFTRLKKNTTRLPMVYISSSQKRLSLFDYVIAGIFLGIFGLPLLALVIEALDFSVLKAILKQHQLWMVVGLSLILSCISTVFSSILTFFLLKISTTLEGGHSRALRFIFFDLPSNMLVIVSPSIIASIMYVFVPPIYMKTRVFQFLVLCILLSFSFVPSMVRALSMPYTAHQKRYGNLCFLLGIKGSIKFKNIDWPLLRGYIGYGLSIPFIFTLCDIKCILFLTSGTLKNLPLLIYETIEDKLYSKACSLSMILLCLILLINMAISKVCRKNYGK